MRVVGADASPPPASTLVAYRAPLRLESYGLRVSDGTALEYGADSAPRRARRARPRRRPLPLRGDPGQPRAGIYVGHLTAASAIDAPHSGAVGPGHPPCRTELRLPDGVERARDGLARVRAARRTPRAGGTPRRTDGRPSSLQSKPAFASVSWNGRMRDAVDGVDELVEARDLARGARVAGRPREHVGHRDREPCVPPALDHRLEVPRPPPRPGAAGRCR